MRTEDETPKTEYTMDEWYDGVLMFEELDDDMYGPCSPSSGISECARSESFDEMIRRKTNDNLRRLFGEDG